MLLSCCKVRYRYVYLIERIILNKMNINGIVLDCRDLMGLFYIDF